MKLLYCGFNGFKQIPHENIIISKLSTVNLHCLQESEDLNISKKQIENITRIEIFLHWSYNVLIINNNIYKLGYCNSSQKSLNQKLRINNNNQVTDIFCKDDVLILLDSDKNVFAYKNNSEYELETVSKIHYNKYVTNNVPCKSEVVQYLCAGHFLTAIVSLDNNLYKTPKEARASVDGTVIDISSGFEHTLLLTAEGKVYSWGVGSRGQLGHGEISNERFPRLVEALDGIQISKISAGGWHSCAVGILGELYTWGWNEKGQLGLPIPKSSLKSLQKSIATETDSFNAMFTPKLITFIDNEFEVFQISSGNRHTVILGNDMKLYGTGWNKYKQLGIEDTSDVILQFCEIPSTGFILTKDIKLKCGPWSTALIVK